MTLTSGRPCEPRLLSLFCGVGDRYLARSIIGSEFQCQIEAETTVGGKPAVIPSITGRAWITGTHQHMLDPTDPWPGGYRLTDTWPG